jgi:sphinganine-1-phosphate aldolase
MEITFTVAEGVRQIDGLRLVGQAEAMIVCFAGEGEGGLDIYSVGDRMSKRGWSLNPLQSPACMHICITLRHVKREQQFLDDLKACVEEAKNDKNKKSGNAAIYGMVCV